MIQNPDLSFQYINRKNRVFETKKIKTKKKSKTLAFN